MTATTRPAWQGTHDAATITRVWRRAITLIQRHGYNRYQVTRVTGEPYTLVTAIEDAARDCATAMTLTAGELEDDAASRLGGVLRLTGQVTYDDANSTTLDLWDAQMPAHTAADAVAVLGLAVSLAIAADYSVITTSA